MHRTLLGGAAVAVLLTLVAAPAAHADIVRLRDGKVLPAKYKLKPGEGPSDDQLRESGTGNLELTYDAGRLGASFNPAEVADIWITAATAGNADFKSGERNGEAGFYEEAAEDFARAAEGLRGLARQQALFLRVRALAAREDLDGTMAAVDALLADSPKSYWYGQAQELRARILASRGKFQEAEQVLRRVAELPGMNVRDRFNAEWARVFLTQQKQAGRDKAKYAQAERAYRDVVSSIEATRERALAEAPRLKCLVGIATCLVWQDKHAEAKKHFEEVTRGKGVDATVLAAAYSGLGDVVFFEAKAAQTKGDRAKAQTLLEDALLHYLRVALHYGNEADPGDGYNATVNAARVFAAQFTQSDAKDCVAGQRAYSFYVRAVRMLPPTAGEPRRLLNQEGREFKERLDKACKP